MRMRLKNYRQCPPDLYRYTVPQTGYRVRSMNVDSWLQQTKKHLESNNLPIPIDLLEQMEEQLCDVLPPGWCEFDDPNRPRVNTEFTWVDVETGSKTFIDWMLEGRPLVAPTEAERRARICVTCYMNTRAVGCGQSCRELVRKLVGLFVPHRTSVDEKLHSCSVCRCYLKAKVQFPLTIIEAHDNPSLQSMYPKFCWLRKDSDNYKP